MRRLMGSFAVVITVLLGSILLVLTSTFLIPVGWAAEYSIAVPGTGNPTPTTEFTNREVSNFVIPVNPACALYVSCTTPQQVDYYASFWPIVLFGADQWQQPTWNDSVNSGIYGTNGVLGSAYGPKAPPFGLGPEGSSNYYGLIQTLNFAYTADPTRATDHFNVTGYSQGATVASYFKNIYPNLATQFPNIQLPAASQLQFEFAANPQRPNGGIFVRPGVFGPWTLPIVDATFGIPARTDVGIKTTDIVIQYDGVSDFPAYPLNALADINALAGLLFIHPTYPTPHSPQQVADGTHPYGYSVTDFQNDIALAQVASDSGHPELCPSAVNCQVHGDTTYLTFNTVDLPMLAPFRYIGEQISSKTGLPDFVRPFADLIQPDLKVLIETGYDRSDYGKPMPFQFIVPLNPAKVLTLAPDLINSTIQGIQDFVGDITGTRPPALPTQDPFATAVSLGTPAAAVPSPLAPHAATITTAPPASKLTLAPKALTATAPSGTTSGTASGSTTSGVTSQTASGTTLSVGGKAKLTSVTAVAPKSGSTTSGSTSSSSTTPGSKSASTAK
ncbi:PE-PPE domain-containing protein [Mycobacterium sp. CBMA293]|nr:PE-PPE domain-containing protein [Mycolicibacterium sp. CBMA 360]MUL59211.1 PE-PPE domain-containing protein [Mycolicibacterium sp. CBMA 335]MUL70936.1 PE-PPE domain-containing protein [Mycolicibacterium sp. CBMA 311]MUL94579.1 PE-PPE domain-containing protein [Mycolicibacterium sp. CBMA 230]MUM09244.1 hypothetical protein [Mycolicibacterium sp. CBMA 213]MUM11698.1 PE-PPE domain-containing protein [Mycolicibacterium sp. CBMA 293]MUM30603.1 PE-PPE domain-containing protein [Mycolicibacteriu